MKEQDGRIWVCRGANDDVIVHDKKLFTVHDDGSMTEGAPAHVKSLDVTGCDLTELAGMPEVVDGVFYCRMNDMKSLQGAPKRAEVFDCSDSY